MDEATDLREAQEYALPRGGYIEAPSVAAYVDAIRTLCASAARSVLDIGIVLQQAKLDLERGEWLRMIGKELPFGADTAQKLLRIARHPVLGNAAHAQYLPAAWSTLYELARLPAPVIEAKLASGEITPDLERKDVLTWRPGAKPAPKAPGKETWQSPGQAPNEAPEAGSPEVERQEAETPPPAAKPLSPEEQFRAASDAATAALDAYTQKAPLHARAAQLVRILRAQIDTTTRELLAPQGTLL